MWVSILSLAFPGIVFTTLLLSRLSQNLETGTRALLLPSGLGERFWKYAQRCVAFHCNVSHEPPKVIQELAKEREVECAGTRYESHLGYPYEGYLIPFVWCIVLVQK